MPNLRDGILGVSTDTRFQARNLGREASANEGAHGLAKTVLNR